MSLTKIAILCPLISVDAPQPLRFREFIKYWENHYEITVLAYQAGEEMSLVNRSTKLRTLNFTLPGRFLIKSRLKKKQTGATPLRKFKAANALVKSAAKSININQWFFPDIFIVEYRNIRKRLEELISETRPDVLIISTSPFTLMLLPKFLKKKFPNLTIIVDTGDPFYGNSSDYARSLIHRLFSKRIEAYCLSAADLLVVPTEILRSHYLKYFNKLISGDRVRVIEQGINNVFTGISEISAKERHYPVQAIYAGSFYRRLREPFELYKAVLLFRESEIRLKIFGNTREFFDPPAADPRFIKGGLITTDELASEYMKSDFIVFIDNAYGVQVPGKLNEVLAVKRPLLYIYQDEKAPSYQLVKGLGGIIMARNNSVSIKDGIESIATGEYIISWDRNTSGMRYESLARKYRLLIDGLERVKPAT